MCPDRINAHDVVCSSAAFLAHPCCRDLFEFNPIRPFSRVLVCQDGHFVTGSSDGDPLLPLQILDFGEKWRRISGTHGTDAEAE